MAERTTVTRECDCGGCRRRKGVQKYRYAVCILEDNGTEVIQEEIDAEHCQYHYDINVRRLKDSAQNTKAYE